jgi:hypothetical protein
MKIKVFIPTFKRIKSLKAVLYSLRKVHRLSDRFEYICYVVNNFPDNYGAIETLVAEANANSSGWQFISIQREKTLPPIENWYGAISNYANDGDIVFLQGDDDLFLPDSIRYRVKCLLKTEADLLITKHAGGILFYDRHDLVSIIDEYKAKASAEHVEEVKYDNLWSAIFISNNTYRMSPILRKAFELAMKWCDEQAWLSFDQRTIMYPIYIPLALNVLSAKVVDSNKVTVIRGMNIDECRQAWWGVPGWNSGFLHWAFCGVLQNNDLKAIKTLDTTRNAANNFVAEWFWTFYVDPRISRYVRQQMIERIGLPTFNSKTFISSLKFVIRGLLMRIKAVRAVVDVVKAPKTLVSPYEFIDGLYEK